MTKLDVERCKLECAIALFKADAMVCRASKTKIEAQSIASQFDWLVQTMVTVQEPFHHGQMGGRREKKLAARYDRRGAHAQIFFAKPDYEKAKPLKPHIPSRSTCRQVEVMAGHGVTEVGIAESLGIGPKCLRRHYRPSLDRGHAVANYQVARALYRAAISDGPQSLTAAIFWLKCRAPEWRENADVVVRYDDG